MKRSASFVPHGRGFIESRKAPFVERSVMRAATAMSVPSLVRQSTSTTFVTGRDRVRVAFRPVPGSSTGVVYDVRVVRLSSPAP